jgi:hypothetical protein
MKYFVKYLSSLIIILLLFSCSWFKADRNKEKKTAPPTTTTTQKPEPKDQYRIAENYSGNKSQIIDLITGPATFDIKYEGNSRFLALLMKGDGTILDTLANVNGSYKGTKEIKVPETTAYILDVRCDGVWSIYRK